MDDEAELRLECLKLAVQHPKPGEKGDPVASAIANAAKYVEFCNIPDKPVTRPPVRKKQADKGGKARSILD